MFLNELLYLRQSYKILNPNYEIFKTIVNKNLKIKFSKNYIYENFIFKLYKCSSL